MQDSCDDKMASIMEPSAHAMLVQLHAKGPPVHQGLGSDSRDTHEGGSKKRKLRVSICHNMPPYMGRPAAWRACQRCPAPGAYAVGRAMVETDK